MFLNRTQSHRSLADIGRDLQWGLSWSGAFTVFFTGLGVLARLIRGQKMLPGVPMSEIILVYLILGLVGGLLVGLFRPLTQFMAGVCFLGAIWGIFLGLCIRVMARGWRDWQPGEAVLMLFFVAGGGFIAASFRRGVVKGQNRRDGNDDEK